MASRQEVLTYVLSELQANFDLPMPKSDPAYAAMVRSFEEHLTPFSLWELKEGAFEFIHNAKNRKWPAVGLVVAACQQAQRDRLPPEKRGQKALPSPADKKQRRDFRLIGRAHV